MTKTAQQDRTVFAFFTEIGIIDQLGRTAFERVLPDGMKVSHFTVLNHFARLGGERSPAELARAFQVTKAAITNTLQRLGAAGYIEISPDPEDGRGKKVRITESGLAARERAIDALQIHIQPMLADFDVDQFEAALPFLQQVRAWMDKARD